MIKSIKEKIYRLLKYTQKYTNLDHIYLAKSGFWISTFNIVSILLGIATMSVFTHFSNKMTLGYYQYVLAVVGTVWIFSLPGVNTSLIQSISRGNDADLFVGLKAKLKYSLLGSLGLILFAIYSYFFKDNQLFAKLFIIAAIFFPVHSAFSCIFSYFTAKKLFAKLSIFQFLLRFISVASLILTIVFLKNIVWIVLVYFLISSIFNFTFYLYLIKKNKLNISSDPDMLAYGKKLTLINIIPQIFNNYDSLIIPVFLGVEALAIYTVVVKIPNTIKGFLNSFDNIFIPKLVNVKGALFLSKIKNLWVILIFFIFVAIVILSLPFVMKILFGHEYETIIYFSQIYAIIIIPMFLRRLINNWLMANKHSTDYFKSNTSLVIGNAILITVALIFFKSILVVIIAKLFVVFLNVFYGLYLIKKEIKKV